MESLVDTFLNDCRERMGQVPMEKMLEKLHPEQLLHAFLE